MKKLSLFISMGFFGLNCLAQQTELTPNFYGSSHAEMAPEIHHGFIPGSKATWDIQLLADISTSTGSLGQAGVAFYNNEFWTSLWASDTIIRYTSAGTLIQKFQIPGVTGVRSITTDGTNLYMGNASSTIYIVDPGTQMMTGTISTTNTARFLTYDATLNAGAGGFWMGNFNTDIDAIDMSGNILSTIPIATHTLSGMYGAAIDNVSTGGPYLWVHHQGGTNSDDFTALQLPAGTPTIYTHNVFPDLSGVGATSSLAGGAFLTTDLVLGQTSLIGLSQGTPANAIIAYELSLSASTIDIQANSVIPQKGYTKIPLSQVFNETFDISYTNGSSQTVDSVVADIEYYYNAGLISSESVFDLNVASAASGVLNSSFLPSNGIGTYDVVVTLRPDVSLTDGQPGNNSVTFTFDVTDSIYARDNSVETGTPYVVSATNSAYAASIFEVFATDTVSGIWIQLTNPNHGDTTYPVLYDYNGSLPASVLSIGDTTIIDSTITMYYLKFNELQVLTPGMYTFGCYEGVGTGINLAQSNSLFTAGTNYYYVGGTWSPSGIATARFIRPVFGQYAGPDAGLTETSDNEMLVYPVPAHENVTVSFKSAINENTELMIQDLSGMVVTTETLEAGTNEITLSTTQLSAGVYFISIEMNGVKSTKKIVVE